MTFIVIPYGDKFTVFGRTIELHVTHMNVGLLYVLALTSVGVYGIVLPGGRPTTSTTAGRTEIERSDDQLRTRARTLHRERLALHGLIGSGGDRRCAGRVSRVGLEHLSILVVDPVFIIFYIASLAETNRTPFDLPEADSELVAAIIPNTPR